MKLDEAKQQFIQTWGVLGTQWGINRTMAQIHALLLIAPKEMSADDIMNDLKISRGNANMNIRELMDWGIVEKKLIPGERKEFFIAEKDIWKVAMKIINERKKRELDPVINVLDQLKDVETSDSNKEDAEAFKDVIGQLQKFTKQADKSLDGLLKADEHWFTGTLIKLFK